MKITMEMFRPTKVVNWETYKARMCEIYAIQIASAFRAFGNWLYWVLVFWTLPCAIIYSVMCFVESVLVTVLLPLFFVPGIRWFGIFPEAIIIGFYTIIATFGMVQQC